MEWPFSFPLWSIVLIFLPILALLQKRKHSSRRLPPGPRGLPLVGNMFDLGTMPHRTLATLGTKHGPLIWLRLGSQRILVILTAKVATEFFKHHDLSFADRNINETMRVLDYDKGSLILAPYGSHWRVMKKICVIEMLTVRRINETASVREKCVVDMIKWIQDAAGKNDQEIELGRFVFIAGFNLLGNLLLSKNLLDPSLEKGSHFFAAMNGLTQWTGLPNVADFFPCLKWLDLQGLKRKTTRDMRILFEIAAQFIKERIQEKEMGRDSAKRDFLDVLLDFEGDGKEEPQKLSEHHITVFILEFFMAGTESTTSTIEWAMTELLANPDSMTKVKSDLNQIVGQERDFKEADINDLPYLQAVIKETLRLHPPTPFLVPRKAVEDVNFMGYDIPCGTQVFVNAWAIGRDTESWNDPLSFKPDRFIGSNIDYKGQHYELIPFGAGRRMCAGVPLAHKMLNLILGALLHNFEWDLESHMTPETIDWEDRIGLTARKLAPLKVIPRKHKV
ncbi:cytochrome P450 76A2 [Spinacia oleracea]|uniref:Cytochrome P450 76A2 n=1 Tax=Spinacia oleracea TaxID=3562 RepID=A0A9R0JY82_SPIOL|nr:cytochrome P450 76A2-like [Spinacia oleracea]